MRQMTTYCLGYQFISQYIMFIVIKTSMYISHPIKSKTSLIILTSIPVSLSLTLTAESTEMLLFGGDEAAAVFDLRLANEDAESLDD